MQQPFPRTVTFPHIGSIASGHRHGLLLILICSLSGAAGARAGSPHPGPAQSSQGPSAKLGAVTIHGSSRYTSIQILAITGLHSGETVTKESLQAAANRLAQVGYFSDVSYQFTSTGDRVDVTYSVKDAPALPVDYDNFPWFTDEEISQAIRTELPLFDGTSPLSGTVPEAIAAAIQKLLLAHGIHASVRHEENLGDIPGSSSQLVYSCSGASLPIASLEFTDPLATQDKSLQLRLRDLIGKPFSRSGVSVFNLEQVRPLYLSHGFLAVHFLPPEVRFSGNPGQPQEKVIVLDRIQTGSTYTWGGVVWSGNQALSASDLGRFTPFATGSVADGMKIQGAWQDASAGFAHIGYLDVKLNVQQRLDDTSRVASYFVAVTQGIQYHMGDLVLTGLSLESERRLRQAWSIPKGAIFDKSEYDSFILSGVGKALSGLPARLDHVGSVLDEHPESATVNVLMDFH